jgi:hypothetical protein
MIVSIPARPDGKKIIDMLISDDKWNRVYQRSVPNVDSIDIHNEGTQTIRISSEQNPAGTNYDTLNAGQFHSEDIDPKEIYIQRTSNVSNPNVKIIIRYFTDEQLKKLAALEKSLSGLPV